MNLDERLAGLLGAGDHGGDVGKCAAADRRRAARPAALVKQLEAVASRAAASGRRSTSRGRGQIGVGLLWLKRLVEASAASAR